MRRSAVLPLGLLLALVTTLAGCGSEGEPGVAAGPSRRLPVGRSFSATGASEGGRQRPLPAKAGIRFLPDGRVAVATGCNGASGTARLEEGRMVGDGFEITEMACVNPGVMEQETFVMSVVEGRPELLLDGDVLVLRTATAEIRFLDQKVADPDRPLEGTRWQVTGQFDPQVAGTTAATEARLVLSDGRLRFTGACLDAEGPATVTGTSVAVGALTTSTPRPCSQPQQVAETEIRSLLSGSLQAKVTAASLLLTRPDGTGLTLVAAG